MKFILSTLFLINSFILSAQFNKYLSSDRPGQANSANTLGWAVFQLQSGYSYQDFITNYNFRNFEQHDFTNVLRAGVAEKVDIILTTNYSIWHNYLFNSFYSPEENKLTTKGLSYFSFGSRFNLLNNEDGLNLGFQASLKLPVLAENINFENPAPKLELLINTPIVNGLGFSFNLATETTGNENNQLDFFETLIHSYVLNLNYTYKNQFGIFVETFGYFDSESIEKINLYDAGIFMLPHPNLQFDFSILYFKDDYFINKGLSVGLTYRLLSLSDKTL